jgi:hypothetical protein
MKSANSALSLKDLITYCCQSNSLKWESAWREFLKRYKVFIYQCVTRRCLSWRTPRLKRQLSDTVNDIVSEILNILVKSLASFREVDDDHKFKLWLATVSNREVGHYLRREFCSELTEPDLEEFRNYIRYLENDLRWELYESVVEKLRVAHGEKKKNLERDINIFLLYTWSDLSQPMILAHPCYQDLGHRVIDNVVNRMRECLKGEKILHS